MSPLAPRLVVSVHDVSPATATQSCRWVDELDERGVPASLLVIPGPWRGRTLAAAPEFAGWLQACRRRGHEICLHGWDHGAAAGAPLRRALVGQLVARGCSEFWSLEEDEAAARARRGLDLLAGLGLDACGFTPPGWLASASAIQGLRRAGLRYVATHRSVSDLRSGYRLRAPVICHRPGGRGERVGAALMAHAPGRFVRSGRTLRVALHPDDLGRPGLREAALEGIEAALTAGAVPLTYRSVMASPGAGPGPGGRVIAAANTYERFAADAVRSSDGVP